MTGAAKVNSDSQSGPEISVPFARRWAWSRVGATAASLAAVIAIALFAAKGFMAGRDAEGPNEAPTAITLASLPAGTTIPRLDTAGLKLVSLVIDPQHIPIVKAAYLGPHGCRLDLQAWSAGTSAAPLEGTSRHTWTVGDLIYELVAHGMPVWRFTIIADASELQTRLNADHKRINRRLRQAEVGAPPYTG